MSWIPIFSLTKNFCHILTIFSSISLRGEAANVKEVNMRYFLMFAIAFAIVIIGKRYALSGALEIAEEIMRKVRIRIGEKLGNTELVTMENMKKEDIYTRIAQDTSQISEAAIILVNAWQSSIVLVFCILFIAILSKLAFVIVICGIGAAILVYLSNQKSIGKELRETTIKESKFLQMLAQIIDGFKELKVNRDKKEHQFHLFQKITNEASDLKVQTGFKFVTQVMFTQVFFYTLLGIIIFILPRFIDVSGAVIIRLASAVLFIIGPVNLLVTSIPVFARANNAVRNIYTIEQKLDNANRAFKTEMPMGRKMESFSEIKLDKASFSYLDRYDSPLFTVGPADLTINQGETIFLVGGNGSGKTTLLKLMIGLYYPSSGSLSVDGQPLDKFTYPAYRELFSLIFHDFYLFDRIYGIDNIDHEKVAELLKLMDLDKKTEIVDGVFSTVNLSTGQRKRLAMIVSILEDKPIYIFDEWAADQDPVFRKYFYEILLQDFKKQGKTIIAVSHDDRYFGFADRVLKMEFGKFI
ncbi:cyclic peptide export ABC transporter [Desulfobacterales bacterium HSG16]|nr:cyclic peptide export ABC transporter [Desulfobacterales bacterium HSG16]